MEQLGLQNWDGHMHFEHEAVRSEAQNTVVNSLMVDVEVGL